MLSAGFLSIGLVSQGELAMRRLAALFTSLALVAPLSAAQWAANPFNPGGYLTMTGFMVVHDDGANLRAFSAFTRSWRTIAPTGSAVIGQGDYAALIQLPGGAYRAYSARLDAVAPLPAGLPVINTYVEDDVILVMRGPGAVPTVAEAYSAQTNAWAAVGLAGAPFGIATSRYVIAFQDIAGNQAYGFGARQGVWQGQAIGFPGPLTAAGNVAAFMNTDAAGVVTAIAFSGVANAWASSPPVAFGVGALQVAHDVAHVLIGPAAACSPCGYSAYTNNWVVSPNASPLASYTITLKNKYVLVQRAAGGPPFEAIGALPQAAWAPIAGAGLAVMGLGQDTAVLDDPAMAQIHAFSGLCGGLWVPRPVMGAPSFKLTTAATVPNHGCLVYSGGEFHAFSPAASAWAPPLLAAGANWWVGESVAIVEGGLAAFAWSARYNAWVPAPAAAAGAVLNYGGLVGGAVAARERIDPFGVPWLDAFDERSSVWKTGPLGAPIVTVAPGAAALGNALILDEGVALEGFSAQRSDLAPAAGVAFGIFPLVMAGDQNVAVALDTANVLHAFGSPADSHVFYNWPAGSETHAFARPFAPVQTMRCSVLAPAGAMAATGVSAVANFAGFALGGLGTLYLFPPFLAVTPFVAASALGVASTALPLPAGGGGACVQLWSQGGNAATGFVGNVPEPILVF